MREAETERNEWIAQRVALLTGERPAGSPVIARDTTHYMYIDRGDLLELDGDLFLVCGNEKEGRFGIDEQPKFWVKRAVSLASGRKQILKLVCRESFKVQVGSVTVTCWRSGEKEAGVLNLVRGDPRFMQGRALRDCKGNIIRILDFIEGTDLLSHIHSLNFSHETYFHRHFPSILAKTIEAFEAIRNDHIYIASEDGRFRWIDFDLTQDFDKFDLWSLGNVLHCIVGQGFVTFRDAILGRPDLSGRLTDDDASVFFPHRVMNLGKVFPYLPGKLNDILLRYSIGARSPYDSIAQVVADLGACCADLSAVWL